MIRLATYLVPVLIAGFLFFAWNRPHAEVDFNAEVRPLLNDKCMGCHGGVKQAGGFSMLFPEEAVQPGESGRPPIVPGHPDSSEIMNRVTHHDPEERMPAEGAPLNQEEIELLETWIAQGAAWETHWAYLPVAEQEIPSAPASWVRHPIDAFVHEKAKEAGLTPSPPADCYTLARRVSFDLIGLPPDSDQVQDLCTNFSDQSYTDYIDSLLASPHYGEHMAAMWLDLARYADTKGYRPDLHREMWRFRDWVIDAFNSDMPFDQFSIEQLAGDLLPAPTDEQLLATAFHRNTMTNDEGGSDDREFRVAAVLDRVNTTFEVWQGTTMSCVQCHSHPYDPFRHEDYFKVYAFFNNTEDRDRGDDWPRWPTYSHAQKASMDSLLTAIEELQGRPSDTTLSLEQRRQQALLPTIESGLSANTYQAEFNGGTGLRVYGDSAFFQVDIPGSYTTSRLSLHYAARNLGGQVAVHAGAPDGPVIGATQMLAASDNWSTVLTRELVLNRNATAEQVYLVFSPLPGEKNFTLNISHVNLAPRSPASLDSLQARLHRIRPIETPVMKELPEAEKRVTTLFERGNWLTPGDTLQAGVPGMLPQLPDEPDLSRLDLAAWLFKTDNPLTARVTVNRLWAWIFGNGLVETLEDFGTQGATPSHPELLDWLAIALQTEYDWKIKPLLRDWVLSSTYRQSSEMTPAAIEADPQNKWLARAPRKRLSAEQIRDQGLVVSGLFNNEIYGPSVMPEQPPGIWSVQLRPHIKWRNSTGKDKYRRGLYTYWRRSSPYPSMITFDSPSREFCLSRRVQTNTPLQAFVTLNDPVYVEMAQALAKKMWESKALDPAQQIAFGYQRALIAPIPESTLGSLTSLYETSVQHYSSQPDSVRAQAAGLEQATPEQAALVQIASSLLNLDAYLTKE